MVPLGRADTWVSYGTPLPLHQAPCPPISFASKVLPESSHFPLSLGPPAKSLLPPASTLASCCNPPPAICSPPGSQRDIFKTANHILSLSKLAPGINLRTKPTLHPIAPKEADPLRPPASISVHVSCLTCPSHSLLCMVPPTWPACSHPRAFALALSPSVIFPAASFLSFLSQLCHLFRKAFPDHHPLAEIEEQFQSLSPIVMLVFCVNFGHISGPRPWTVSSRRVETGWSLTPMPSARPGT